MKIYLNRKNKAIVEIKYQIVMSVYGKPLEKDEIRNRIAPIKDNPEGPQETIALKGDEKVRITLKPFSYIRSYQHL